MSAYTCTCGAVATSQRTCCGKPMASKPAGSQPTSATQLAFGRSQKAAAAARGGRK
jgi:hypothetical protein